MVQIGGPGRWRNQYNTPKRAGLGRCNTKETRMW